MRITHGIIDYASVTLNSNRNRAAREAQKNATTHANLLIEIHFSICFINSIKLIRDEERTTVNIIDMKC